LHRRHQILGNGQRVSLQRAFAVAVQFYMVWKIVGRLCQPPV
jgi:hypothetical protein